MKKTAFSVIMVSLALLIVAVFASLIITKPSSDFSFEGTWKNVGETTYGHIYPGQNLNVFDDKHCDIFGDNNTYKLERTTKKNEYQLTVSNLPYDKDGTIVFTIIVEDDNHIIIDHRDCKIHMERL